MFLTFFFVWGGPPLSREKSRDVLEQPPEYLLKQEDSS